MPRLPKKRSALERRLEELQAEEALVRGDIKVISKRLRRKEGLASSLAGGAEKGGALHPRGKAPGAGSRGSGARHVRADGSPPGASRGDDVLLPPPAKRSRNPLFTSYFSAGSIVPARPLRQEKSVQRNKAIFMVVFVLVVAFVVLKLIF